MIKLLWAKYAKKKFQFGFEILHTRQSNKMFLNASMYWDIPIHWLCNCSKKKYIVYTTLYIKARGYQDSLEKEKVVYIVHTDAFVVYSGIEIFHPSKPDPCDDFMLVPKF